MPALTRWFLRTAIACLVLAMLLALAAAVPALLPGALRGGLQPVYFHLLMVGWVTQMIFGVAIWMFPRVPPARSFGNPVLGWGCYLALNTGLLLRVVFEPLAASAPGPLTAAGLAGAALLQLLAVAAFAATIWRRVRGA